MKTFESFLNEQENKSQLSEDQIAFLHKHHIFNFTVNDDLSIDVHEERVSIVDQKIQTFPVVFNKVKNRFDCSCCYNLISLKGAPSQVEDFVCNWCTSLNSLEGAPSQVESFDCTGCQSLISLKGAPSQVKEFYCDKCVNLNKLEKETFLLDENGKLIHIKLLADWLKSNLSIEKFREKAKGNITSRNFNI